MRTLFAAGPGRTGLLSSVAAALALMSAAAAAQSLPPNLYMASAPAGSLQHTVASAIAKVVSDATPTVVVVRPYTGTTTFFPLVARGEVEFGLATSVDFALSYRGPEGLQIGGRNPYPHAPELRLVASGSPLVVGLLVRNDSGIKSVHDLKGKRVVGEFPAHLGAYVNTYAQLRDAGLGWSDVRVVAVAGLTQGVDALEAGRVDVATLGVGAPRVRELDAKFGVRHVTSDCSPEAQKRVTDEVPGYYFIKMQPGPTPGIVEETCLTAYALGIITAAATPEPVVAAVAKALYEHAAELQKFHPSLRQWTRDAMVVPSATIPYHPAAVQAYKEAGAWSPEMERVQERLLAIAN